MRLSWLKVGMFLAGMCGLSVAIAAPQVASSVSSTSEHSSLAWTQAENLAAHQYLMYGGILQRAELKLEATPENSADYAQYQTAYNALKTKQTALAKQLNVRQLSVLNDALSQKSRYHTAVVESTLPPLDPTPRIILAESQQQMLDMAIKLKGLPPQNDRMPKGTLAAEVQALHWSSDQIEAAYSYVANKLIIVRLDKWAANKSAPKHARAVAKSMVSFYKRGLTPKQIQVLNKVASSGEHPAVALAGLPELTSVQAIGHFVGDGIALAGVVNQLKAQLFHYHSGRAGLAVSVPMSGEAGKLAIRTSSTGWNRAEALAARKYLLFGNILHRAALKIEATPKNSADYAQYQAAYNALKTKQATLAKQLNARQLSVLNDTLARQSRYDIAVVAASLPRLDPSSMTSYTQALGEYVDMATKLNGLPAQNDPMPTTSLASEVQGLRWQKNEVIAARLYTASRFAVDLLQQSAGKLLSNQSVELAIKGLQTVTSNAEKQLTQNQGEVLDNVIRSGEDPSIALAGLPQLTSPKWTQRNLTAVKSIVNLGLVARSAVIKALASEVATTAYTYRMPVPPTMLSRQYEVEVAPSNMRESAPADFRQVGFRSRIK